MENKSWFGVRVKPRSEFRVSGELSLRGFEALLPARRVRRRWSDRIKVSEQPLFPGYLFCRFDPLERIRILDAPCVIQIVGIGKMPLPVSPTEIAAIQTMMTAKSELMPWPYLRAGQQVRLNAGPLAGIQGIVVRTETGSPRVVVSVTLLQRSVAVEVDCDWLAQP